MNKFRFSETAALAAALFTGDAEQKSTVEPLPESSTVAATEQVSPETPKELIFLQTEVKPIFQNPEFFLYHKDGEFSEEEKKMRWVSIDGVGQVFHDVGLDFYFVENEESLDDIKEKLEPIYPYLKKQKGKINAFNISAKWVTPGMMLPIPVERGERQITDQEFLRFGYEALDELVASSEYGAFVQMLRNHISDEKIVTTLLAIAKQESGGKPIGQFELHRYEPKKEVFSYSIFHILMTGPGETARKNFGMTIGQTYHPRNAVKLFFGFVVEKIFGHRDRSRDDVVKKAEEKFLKVFELQEDFADFYNGKGWRTMNPNYLSEVQGYYGEVQHYFEKNEAFPPLVQNKPKSSIK